MRRWLVIELVIMSSRSVDIDHTGLMSSSELSLVPGHGATVSSPAPSSTTPYSEADLKLLRNLYSRSGQVSESLFLARSTVSALCLHVSLRSLHPRPPRDSTLYRAWSIVGATWRGRLECKAGGA